MQRPDPGDESRTWVNRNGTFIRVLIAVDDHTLSAHLLDHVDVSIHRLIVLSACGADQLNATTERLRIAALVHGVELVPAHGHHRELLDRIGEAAQRQRHP